MGSVSLTLEGGDPSSAGAVFHAGDVVKGLVHINIEKDISVRNIQIKLLGISTSKFTQSMGNIQIEHLEKHDLIYDVNTLFPPPEVRNHIRSETKEFSLIKGTKFDFPFEFKFPEYAHCTDREGSLRSNFHQDAYEQDNQTKHRTYDPASARYHASVVPLPPQYFKPTLSGHELKIQYFLKLTIRRSSSLGMSIRHIHPLAFEFRSAPESNRYKFFLSDSVELNKSAEDSGMLKSLFNKSKRSSLAFKLLVVIPDLLASDTERLPVKILLLTDRRPEEFLFEDKKSKGQPVSNELGLFYLKDLDIHLCEQLNLVAQGHYDSSRRKFSLLEHGNSIPIDFANLQRADHSEVGQWIINKGITALNGDEYIFDLSEHFKDKIRVPAITSSFSICNGNLNYYFFAKAKFTTKGNSWTYRKARIQEENVIVVPPVEKLPEYINPPAYVEKQPL